MFVSHWNCHPVDITQLPFPLKLHVMLDDMAHQNGGMEQDIVSWQPHGKAFRVHDPNEFAKTILPRYFKQKNYKSFQRQLHIYGFQRITDKKLKDNGSYYHSLFIRGEKNRCLRMTRQTFKGLLPSATNKPSSSCRSSSSSCTKTEPDFYAEMITTTGDKQGNKLATKPTTTTKPTRSTKAKAPSSPTTSSATSKCEGKQTIINKPMTTTCNILPERSNNAAHPSLVSLLGNTTGSSLLSKCIPPPCPTSPSPRCHELMSPDHFGYNNNPSPASPVMVSPMLSGHRNDHHNNVLGMMDGFEIEDDKDNDDSSEDGDEMFFEGKRFFFVGQDDATITTPPPTLHSNYYYSRSVSVISGSSSFLTEAR